MSASVGVERVRDLRLAAAGLFGAAAVWPLLPVHPPLACPLRTATGVPCPFCGMTRACVAAVQGQLGRALAYNPGAVVLLAIAAVLLLRPAVVLRIRPPVWLVWVGLGALWVWNVGFNPTFD
jgi:hypothetical protein